MNTIFQWTVLFKNTCRTLCVIINVIAFPHYLQKQQTEKNLDRPHDNVEMFTTALYGECYDSFDNFLLSKITISSLLYYGHKYIVAIFSRKMKI